MTRDELTGLIGEYRAGIEAQLHLLNQMADIAQRQREISRAGDLAAFERVADVRDHIMRSLVTIEEGLRAVRQTLLEHRDVASRLPGFREVAVMHRDAVQLVGHILAADQQSTSALADAELARRSALASLEQGETTLAAYRRVLAPPVSTASLLDRRG